MDVEIKHQYTLGAKVRFYITVVVLAAILTGLGLFMFSWSSYLINKLKVDPSSVVNLHDITLSVLMVPAFSVVLAVYPHVSFHSSMYNVDT